VDAEHTALAARHILARLGCRAGENLALIYDAEKEELAQALAAEAARLGRCVYRLCPPEPEQGAYPPSFCAALAQAVAEHPAIVLMSRTMLITPGFIATLGRPDQVPPTATRLFCDWTTPVASLVRLHSADPEEINRYRAVLRRALGSGGSVHITAAQGTDITLEAREWVASALDDGEVYTAPVEGSAHGTIVYDASLFWGRPARPLRVDLVASRIVTITPLGEGCAQLDAFRANAAADAGAPFLAELGLGLNPAADPFGHGMEAEQARCTCHLDLGNALPFGGANASRVHYGGVVWQPTLTVNGRAVLVKGELV
jgi:leucyl aminopeptidase (aminopeptidase T)